jgi:hypothetical protein
MSRLAKLDWPERRLVLRALLLVIAVRAGLCLLPFRMMRRLGARVNRASSSMPVGRHIWAIRAVSRLVPGATCLTQALAAQVLLARSGHDSQIQIGVHTGEDRRFRAHAWLVCQNEIVLGAAEAQRYVPLADWHTTTERAL